MYYKQGTGAILIQKLADNPDWVQWTHHSEGRTHCDVCLMLNGCWFLRDNAPNCPHHPQCHCTLDKIDYAVVCASALSYVTGWMILPNGKLKLNTPYGGK